MRVTIILDSGGFLIDDNTGGENPLNVGYFEAPGPDIEVSEDGKQPPQALAAKLGKHNEQVHVEHVGADGVVKRGVVREQSFKQDILRKDELFPVDTPDFLPDEYDCILHFYSGTFQSDDPRERVFHEHRLSDDLPTGTTQRTRKIANDVLVQFEVGKGEELRLRNSIGTLWSSSWAGSAQQVSVKLRADGSLDKNYFRKALRHKGAHYKLPNPDPPPMNGNNPGAGGG
jgi:hypothetical protein